MRGIKPAVLLRALAALGALAFGIPLTGAVRQASFDGQTVTAVRIVTVKGQVVEQNPANLPLVAGKPYRVETERAAIEKLFATGLYANIHTVATREPGGVRIDFVVEPGYFIGNVRVEGLNPPPNEPQALAALELRLGERFDQKSLKEALDRLKQTLGDEGCYEALLNIELDRDPQTQLMNITVVVTAGPRARLGAIRFENQSRFTDSELLKRSKLSPGTRVTSDRITNAINRLQQFLSKRNFLTARVTAVRGEYNAKLRSLPLTIRVSAGPEVRLTVEGARVSGKRIRKLIPIYQEGAVDPDLLEEGRRNLLDYFERKGYFNSHVEYQIQDEKQQNRETIVYDVQQGAKSRLIGVGFQGNHYFSNKLLASRLNIQPAAFLSPGRFSPKLLQNDLDSIRALYMANGFRDVSVKAHTLENYGGRRNDLFVRFDIQEGPQSRVASIRIEGNHSIPSEELLSVVNSTAGQPYSQANVSNDRDNILALYYNRGFPQASFQYEAKDAGPNRVALTYEITEGSPVRVNRVLLLGYRHTRPGVIRRKVQITPGRPLREADIVATQDHLYNLGIFNRVDIATKDPSGSTQKKDVLINTTEGDRYTLGYGGGVEAQRLASTSSATGTAFDISPLVIFNLTRLNVLGRAQTASIKVRASTLQYSGLLSYQIPNLLTNPKFSLVLSGLANKVRNVNTYTGTRYEGTIEVVQNYSRSTSFLYRYTFRHVLVDAASLHVNPEQIPLFSQPTRVAGLGFTWIRDRRDNPANPTGGSFNTADFSIYSDRLGSSANFARIFFQNSTYTPFAHVLVFARSTRFGIEEPFNGTIADNIPLPERFFAGGGNSLRGFGLNQAGPRDPVTGFPVGGLVEMIFNQELRFPLRLPFVGNALGGALFYDAGNVFSQLSSVTFASSPSSPTDLNYFSHTVGFGLRYATPVGPVSFDVGFQLNPAQFQFSCTAATPGCTNGTELSRLPRFQFFFNIGSEF
ncbi:MAG TPA: outer membrane protein assembly factor BamA [Patescibacteria group bacterium]|nr:outer membrane protein assembly factor BamA [Patescibacteria group bacterium]